MAQVISTSVMSRAFQLSSPLTQASSLRYAVRSLLLRSSIASVSSLSPSLRSSRLCTSPRQTGSRKAPLCRASAATGAPAETAVWNGVLSKEKVDLIQGSYGDVEGKISAEGFGKEFYDVLFEQVPESKALFTRVSRSVQEKMFGDLLKLLIGDLSNADTAVAALKATATRHGKYGVVEAHFPVVGAALLTTLERCLGPAFTPATKEAWAELWATATSVMWSQIVADRASAEN